jgi:hypothetical protein
MAVDLSSCVHCRCLAARRIARAITRHFEARLRPHGLRATQFSILAVLALAGPMPMRKLAARLGLERTTLTRSAALLLEAAYPDWKEAQDSAAEKFPAPAIKSVPRTMKFVQPIAAEE